MAQLAQLTTAEYTARFNDQISAGANAAAQNMEKLANAFEVTEQRAKRVEGSFASLESRLDAGARLSQAKARSDEQLARQLDAINAATARGAITQERANQLTELAAQKQAVYVGQVQRQIAIEEQRNRAILAGNAVALNGANAANSFASANDNARQSSGRFGQVMGQAGFQIQDFATQVSMGQNALLAFGMQFAQFAGFLGTGGALAGAAVMVGVIGANLLMAGDTAAEETRRMEANFGGMKKAAEEVATVIREINDLFLTASERSAAAANRQTAELAANATRLLDATIQRNESNSMELVQAQRELAQQEARIAARDAEIRARTGSRANTFQGQDPSTLFPLRERIAGLEADIYRSNQRIGELNDALARARNAGVVTGEDFGPPAPGRTREPRGGGGGVDREAERQRREDERARREEERAQEMAAREAAREEARALAERERQNRQTTDEIVRYSADRFADLWGNTGRGFAGLMESMLQMVRRTFARIAAEAIIRPIVTPIVSNFVTPLMGSLGLGGNAAGGAAGVSSGGGMFGGLGSLLGGAGAGISSFMARPLFTPGVPLGATQGNFFAGTALPGEAGAFVGGGATAAPVTVGGFLGTAAIGAGLGIAGGNIAGSLRGTANPMPGSMIGTGLGMGLGFLAGGPVGMAIGGALGGTAGGLFGPTKSGMASRSGGDVFLGTDASGMLTITSARGKRFDEGAARTEVQAQLNAINAQISARGLSFAGPGQSAVGFGAASGSPSELSLTSLVGQLRGGNANQMTAFGTLAGRGGNLEEALSAADFITQIFEPLTKAGEQTDAFTAAMEALSKTYEDAITKARDLGLATDTLEAKRSEALAKMRADAQRGFDAAVRGARGEGFVDQLMAVREGYQTNANAYLAAGRDPNTLFAAQISAIVNNLDVKQLTTAIDALNGFDDVAVLFARARKEQLEAADAQIKAAEAAQVTADTLRSALGAGSAIRDYLDRLGATSAGGLSPSDQFANAQGIFGRDLALSRGGDLDALGRITGSAENLLTAGRGMFSSGPEFQALLQMVQSTLVNLPATRSWEQQTLDTLTRIATGQQTAVELLGLLSSDVNRDQRITWPEFEAWTATNEAQTAQLAAALGVSNTSLASIFTRLDANGDGTLAQLEIQSALTAAGNNRLDGVLATGTGTVEQLVQQNGLSAALVSLGQLTYSGNSIMAASLAAANENLMLGNRYAAATAYNTMLAVNGGIPISGSSSASDGMANLLKSLTAEVAELRAEMARMVSAGERTADAAEDTAATNATMARREVVVGRRVA